MNACMHACMDEQIDGSYELDVLHTLTFAPEPRTPLTIEAWLRESLSTRHPLPTRAGMTTELVAKPMPKVMASSHPTKSATFLSSATCLSVVPAAWCFDVDNQVRAACYDLRTLDI